MAGGDFVKKLESLRSLIGVTTTLDACEGSKNCERSVTCSGVGCADKAASAELPASWTVGVRSSVGWLTCSVSTVGGNTDDVGVVGSPCARFGVIKAGDFFEGTVLLLFTVLAVDVGVPGLCVFPEFRDETDTFRRSASYFLRLSAPPLAFDAERRKPDDRDGLAAALLWNSFTVCGSAAVPFMPNRKLSWFSIRKIKTS